MILHSISAYVDHLVDTLDESSQHALRHMTEDELPALHHSWGRAIRNEFKLWEPDHPITKSWHDGNVVIDQMGFDCSTTHPDHVSMEIMRGVWKKVNA